MALVYQLVSLSDPISSLLSTPNRIYEIRDDFDLNNAQLTIGANCVLRFFGGSFSNGEITGDNTSIEVTRNYEVFNNVILSGTWCGEINDLLFHYDPSHVISESSGGERDNTPIREDFTPILRSLLRFHKIDLFRHEYFLLWSPNTLESSSAVISVGTSQSIEINAHGAVWYIHGNKGITATDTWGCYYVCYYFIDFHHLRNNLLIRDLTINDNASTSGYSGYGEENLETTHINYFIFGGMAKFKTGFINVNYDGGGRLVKSYNNIIDAHLLSFKNCDIYSNGFALEFSCTTGQDPNTQEQTSGSIKEIVIDHCVIHNHFSCFVGPLSFVGGVGMGSLKITNSKICGYRGNLEVFGVDSVSLDNCVLVNQGLCSETSNGRPRFFKCSNSSIYLTAGFYAPGSNNIEIGAYKAKGTNLFLLNNYFYMTRRLEFDSIDRLYFYNNCIVVPSSETNYVLVANSIKIGYYENNVVSSPRIYGEQVRVRLDTAFVLAQYSPFRLAYNDDSEAIQSNTFNSLVGLTPMSDLQAYYTVDGNGYARTDNESHTFTAITPINDTFTFSLIGRSFSYSGVHDLASVSIQDKMIHVKQSYGYVFYVTVDDIVDNELVNVVVLRILGADYDAQNQDVRLDITVSQINERFEVFVFVNKELKARYKNDDSVSQASFIPGGLTITSNSSTGIRMIRFVPGGNIVDEPKALIASQIDG